MADARSDHDLLHSFLGGDQTTFAELMRRHEDKIFALAYRMTGDRADALDATQDAFISAFKQAKSFRFDSAFGTWLYRIAMNSCHDLLRKRKRWGPTSEENQDKPDRSVSAVDDSVAARIDVTRALAQLPDEYREAVVMYDLGGISYDEISGITGAPIGTVKSRISRGRRQLAGLLEHRDPSSESERTT